MPTSPTIARLACMLSVAGCVAGAAAQTTYRIVDLTDVTRDPLGLFIVDATAVNGDGVVVGHGFEPVEGKPVALRWSSEGSVVEMLPLLAATTTRARRGPSVPTAARWASRTTSASRAGPGRSASSRTP